MRDTLYRIPRQAKIFGVCAGLAEYFYVDTNLVRVIFVVLFFATNGFMAILYLTLAVFLPENKTSSANSSTNNRYSLSARIQELVSEMRKNNVVSRFRNYFGLSLMLFGFILLFDQFFPDIIIFRWQFVWPVFLIISGLLIITRIGSKGEK